MKSAHTFEGYMHQGVSAQAAGHHSSALAYRLAATELAVDSVERGRAWRDVSASHMKLVQLAPGYAAVERSVDELAAVAPQCRDELYVSQAQLGRVGAFIMAGVELGTISPDDSPLKPGFSSVDTLNLAQNGLRALTPANRPHQYRINFEGRRAAAHVVENRRRAAARISLSAARLALKSEAKNNPTSNPDLKTVQRIGWKAKHLAVAAATFVASVAPRRTSIKIASWATK